MMVVVVVVVGGSSSNSSSGSNGGGGSSNTAFHSTSYTKQHNTFGLCTSVRVRQQVSHP